MKAVLFDFKNKEERDITVDDLTTELEDGQLFWLVFGPDERELAQEALDRMGTDRLAADAFLTTPENPQYDFFDDAILFSLTEANFDGTTLESGILQCLRGHHYLAVMQSAESAVMDTIQQIYREDFQRFARSSGFLIYELASVLLESYRRSFHSFTTSVEEIQLKLFGEVTDTIFSEVSKLTASILAFRRMVFSSRDLFNELATRKSAFISGSTQPTLKIIASRMERLGDDLDSERSVMTETLNLYMGMTSHRTNRIINRLTIFSMIFLPLSFLCGVYGMNFDFMPELRWKPAYFIFWGGVLTFVTTFVTFIKKKNWI